MQEKPWKLAGLPGAVELPAPTSYAWVDPEAKRKDEDPAEAIRRNSTSLQLKLRAEEEAEKAKQRKKEAAAAHAEAAMVDDVLHRIHLKLNSRRRRCIDLFKKIDTGRLSATVEGFCDGLLWLGFEPTDKEFEALVRRLDKDGSGGISLKSFATAIKDAENSLADPVQVAALSARRARTAASALRGPRVPQCSECGAPFNDALVDIDFCKMCGKRRPEGSRPLQKLLGYTPQHSVLLGPMEGADEYMLKIVSAMNARKYRSVDFFRTMDLDGSGIVSASEFKVGLKKMGLTPTLEEFKLIMDYLDKDGTGEISADEFDKAARLLTKKAKLESRDKELDSFDTGSSWRPGDSFTATEYNWHQRSLRSTFSGSMTERSARPHSQWSSSNHGPHGTACSALVGCGSLYDSSVARERYFDSACSGAHATSTKMPPLPLHKTVYKKACFDGRFEKEPSKVHHPSMLRLGHKDRCVTATKANQLMDSVGGVKTFFNTPMMQSSVDKAIFNRDLDFSGDSKFDESFMALYKGAHGISSWHNSTD